MVDPISETIDSCTQIAAFRNNLAPSKPATERHVSPDGLQIGLNYTYQGISYDKAGEPEYIVLHTDL